MLPTQKIVRLKKQAASPNENLPRIFSALGDPGRFRIFKLLARRRDLCVTDVASIFGISVPAASQQLKILELVGLVRRERNGQMICYEIRDDNHVTQALLKMVE